MSTEDRASRLESLLLGGSHAMWTDGDRLAGRDWFDVAFRLAESEADGPAMARSALGLSGLWLHEHRSTAAAVLAETRLRHALAAVGPQSALGLRLRARLAAESDYRQARYEGILAVVEETGRVDDSVASFEAAALAVQCLLAPDRRGRRHALAAELVLGSVRTGRRGDLPAGLLWRVVDRILDADPSAGRSLAGLKRMLAVGGHPAVSFVVAAIDVMLDIRAGRLDLAEDRARACADRGRSVGDPDAVGWHGTHLLAIRWFQGRAGELLPAARDLVNSPTLSAVDDSHLAALALVAAATGDDREATGALTRLRGRNLADLPRSGTWLMTMHLVGEAAGLLNDGATAAVAYDLLRPFAYLPVLAGPGVACFGSAHHALGVASLTVGDTDRAVTHLRTAVRHNIAVGHLPAAALSRARLAYALRLRGFQRDAGDASRELDQARREATGLGMLLPGYETRPAPPRYRSPATCRRRANRWVVELGERSVVVDDSLGMGYLAVLLANPGYEIPAVQLAAGPGLASAAGTDNSAQSVLDTAAVRAYRQRMAELEADLDSADTDRAVAVRIEFDWLAAELRAASGLGGRPRTFSNSDELARVSVGKAIRRALARIEASDPRLGRELRRTVTTGVRCCYRPN